MKAAEAVCFFAFQNDGPYCFARGPLESKLAQLMLVNFYLFGKTVSHVCLVTAVITGKQCFVFRFEFCKRNEEARLC